MLSEPLTEPLKGARLLRALLLLRLLLLRVLLLRWLLHRLLLRREPLRRDLLRRELLHRELLRCEPPRPEPLRRKLLCSELLGRELLCHELLCCELLRRELLCRELLCRELRPPREPLRRVVRRDLRLELLVPESARWSDSHPSPHGRHGRRADRLWAAKSGVGRPGKHTPPLAPQQFLRQKYALPVPDALLPPQTPPRLRRRRVAERAQASPRRLARPAWGQNPSASRRPCRYDGYTRLLHARHPVARRKIRNVVAVPEFPGRRPAALHVARM